MKTSRDRSPMAISQTDTRNSTTFSKKRKRSRQKNDPTATRKNARTSIRETLHEPHGTTGEQHTTLIVGKHKKKKKDPITNDKKRTKQQSKATFDENNTDQTTSSSRKTTSNKKPKRLRPLNGLILALSTLDTSEKHTSSEFSYNSITAECEAAGASITRQVHKKVFAVICNKSAILQATQRVRKALKRHVQLVDVGWIRESVEKGRRIDYEPFLFNELAAEVVRKRNHRADDDDDAVEGSTIDPNAGWSEPVSLDCCCVCHENGDLNCEWCTECNITLARKNMESTERED